MIGVLYGPWLLLAALLLLSPAARAVPRPATAEWLAMAVLMLVATLARLHWGLWGPVHNNGQAPLWIRGALDPAALVFYGSGYFELFGWLARRATEPDRMLFAANALLSGLTPPLWYGVARLVGVSRLGALAGAAVLAVDPILIRSAASESYFSALVALPLAVQLSLGVGVRAAVAGARHAVIAAVLAAGLFACAAARLHPMGYLPLTLCPLVVLLAGPLPGWRQRARLAALSAVVIAVLVLATSGRQLWSVLSASVLAKQAITMPQPQVWAGLIAAAALASLASRWARPAWLPLIGVAALLLLLATQDSFNTHPQWTLYYQRLFWPSLLLGVAPLLPRPRSWAATALSAAAAAAVAVAVTLPRVGPITTEQLEYAFLKQALRDAPSDCTLAAVTLADRRTWEIPGFLLPTSGESRLGPTRAVQSAADFDSSSGCLLYVHSSLCNSIEGRPLCDAVEHDVALTPLAQRLLPAVPSFSDLPYDRSEVDVALFRVAAAASGSRAAPMVSDGAPITAEAAQALYARLADLHEADGCQLVKFDTARARISLVLQPAEGDPLPIEISSTAAGGAATRHVGDWTLAVGPDVEARCATTLAALERVLAVSRLR